jgi:type IV pilus assembly protein PilB
VSNVYDFIYDDKIPLLVSENLAKKHNAIPIDIKDGKLIVAIESESIYALEDFKLATNMNIKFKKYNRDIISESIDYYYKNYVKQDDNTSHTIEILDNILRQSIIEKASDIHIEPQEQNASIRIRVDGYLKEILTYSHDIYNQLITRIKILGKMDIAEKRLPQDGRVDINIDDNVVDLRISTIPTVLGEKLVIRILDRRNFLKDKIELGFTKYDLSLLDKIIKKPNGIILVTGPTGSGKTTTLYSILKDLSSLDKNIVTIEDPVEYKLKGINQIQVNPKIGLTFAGGLRSILRQDPDIIMIGEIRDAETAKIAIRAAITGHLVISTIHTNDAISAINRLIDMDVPPYLLGASLIGVIAQRLVRKACPMCREEYNISNEEKKILDIKEDIKLIRTRRCRNCDNKGYRERTAIYEIVNINSNIRDMILKSKNSNEIKNEAIKNGMTTLKVSCKNLVINKKTTVEEFMATSYMED